MKYFIICLFVLNLALKGVQADKKYKVELVNIKREANFGEFIPEWDGSIQMMEDNTATINVWFILAQDLPDNMKVKSSGYQKNLDGSWQTFSSLVYEVGMCEYIKNDKKTYPGVRKSSNFPETCPFKAGNYSLVNWRFGENLPDDVPGDWWRFHLDYILNGKRATTVIVEVFLNKKAKAPGTQPDVIKKPHGMG